MAKLFKNNGLTIVLMLLFLASILGQWIAGWMVQNEELARHGEETLSLGAYRDRSGIPLLRLRELGERVPADVGLCRSDRDADPEGLGGIARPGRSAARREPRGPGRTSRALRAILKGGDAARWLYAHSLGLALFTLFLLSFVLHWWNSARAAAEEALQHGETALSPIAYLGDPAALVRELPELAERVPLDRRPGRPLDLAQAARIAEVEAGGGAPRADGRRLIGLRARRGE